MESAIDVRIVSTPDTLSGALRVEGTRIPASLVLGCLLEGMDEKQIYEAYPSLPEGAVHAVLVFSSRLLEDADQWLPRDVLQAGRAPEPDASGPLPS